MLKLKRAYQQPELSDGTRILVDRLWPRGLSKERAAVQEWLKDLAPSSDLRRWFNHQPEEWEEFKKRYIQELSSPDKQEMLQHIGELARASDVTLVYAARDTEHSNARVLEEVISRLE